MALFSYFTIQSNLLVIVTVLPLVTDPRHDGCAGGCCG